MATLVYTELRQNLIEIVVRRLRLLTSRFQISMTRIPLDKEEAAMLQADAALISDITRQIESECPGRPELILGSCHSQSYLIYLCRTA